MSVWLHLAAASRETKIVSVLQDAIRCAGEETKRRTPARGDPMTTTPKTELAQAIERVRIVKYFGAANSNDIDIIIAAAERAETDRRKLAALREAVECVTDESKAADILCADGFTMSFHKGSVVHRKLLAALEASKP